MYSVSTAPLTLNCPIADVYRKRAWMKEESTWMPGRVSDPASVLDLNDHQGPIRRWHCNDMIFFPYLCEKFSPLPTLEGWKVWVRVSSFQVRKHFVHGIGITVSVRTATNEFPARPSGWWVRAHAFEKWWQWKRGTAHVWWSLQEGRSHVRGNRIWMSWLLDQGSIYRTTFFFCFSSSWGYSSPLYHK